MIISFYKKSISLVETIFSIVLLSIILFTASDLILNLNKNNNEEKILLMQKIDFESSRLFLNYKINNDNNLDKLKYENEKKTLYYDDDIILKNVYSFSKNNINNIIEIDLCLKNIILTCQKLRIRNTI